MKSSATTPLTQEAKLLFQPARPEQREAILALLAANHLPTADLTDTVRLFSLSQGEQLVGSAGLEVYADGALLRSLSVAEGGRGEGWGSYMVQELEQQLVRQGGNALYLVTTTAEGFFSKRGYRRIGREEVPEGVRASAQFRGLCPASAAVMMKALCPTCLPA